MSRRSISIIMSRRDRIYLVTRTKYHRADELHEVQVEFMSSIQDVFNGLTIELRRILT